MPRFPPMGLDYSGHQEVLPTTDLVTASRQVGRGGIKFLGFTSSAVDPTTSNYPEDRSWGFHHNTASGQVFLTFNLGAAIKKLELL